MPHGKHGRGGNGAGGANGIPDTVIDGDLTPSEGLRHRSAESRLFAHAAESLGDARGRMHAAARIVDSLTGAGRDAFIAQLAAEVDEIRDTLGDISRALDAATEDK